MKLKVGIRTLRFHDTKRRNWENTGPRPILTDVWYPATDEARETDTMIGPSDAPLFKVGRAARDAEPIAGAYPIILLSHGSGGSALQMGWLGSFLARNGYIAAGVNHHGNTALEPFTAEGFLLWWERARDLSVALDLLVEDPLFGPHIDIQRAGAAGFSLGGYTVIALAGGVVDLGALRDFYRNSARDLLRDISQEVPDGPTLHALVDDLLEHDESHKRSYLDPRVRCVFALAPALAVAFTPEGLLAVKTPVKIVVGEADTITPPKSNAARFAQLIPDAELTILDGQVAHYTFLGEGTKIGKETHPALCLDAPGLDRGAIHRKVGALAIEYFVRHLTVDAPVGRSFAAAEDGIGRLRRG
jgi:predicted dienelactone hydrolase